MLNRFHLRTRMAVAIISVVVLSLIVMTVFNYTKSSELIEKEALGKALSISQGYANSIHTDVEKAFIRARALRDNLVNMKKRGLTNNRGMLIDMIRDNVLTEKNSTSVLEPSGIQMLGMEKIVKIKNVTVKLITAELVIGIEKVVTHTSWTQQQLLKKLTWKKMA